MKRSRFSEEQIIAILKEQEAGAPTQDDKPDHFRWWVEPSGRPRRLRAGFTWHQAHLAAWDRRCHTAL